MTDAELDRIEIALAIKLPPPYRDVMRSFPVPACVGNEEIDVWDSADALIAENKHCREDLAWPPHFYALGNSYGDSAYAIDLRDPAAAVWWVDHWSFERSSTQVESKSFSDWAAKYFQGLQADLESDGIDPTKPLSEQTAETPSGRLLLWLFLTVVLIVLAAKVWAWLN